MTCSSLLPAAALRWAPLSPDAADTIIVQQPCEGEDCTSDPNNNNNNNDNTSSSSARRDGGGSLSPASNIAIKMESTPDHDSGLAGSAAAATAAADAAAAAAAAAAAGRAAAPYGGLSATTAAELSQLARAALQGGGAPGLFASETPGALDVAAGGCDSAALAAVSAALAAGFGAGSGNPDASSSLAMASMPGGMSAAESALNSLLSNAGLGMGYGNLAGNLGNLAGLAVGDASGNNAFAGLPPSGRGRDQTDAEEEGATARAAAAANANKALSSKFRGVCWNKKNRRWQAAINSSGKYLYLGSFTDELDAARQFDRAAIKIRGKKAKLNFQYGDYVGEDGNLLEDIVLPVGNSKEDPGPSSSRGRKRGSSHGGGSSAAAAGGAAYCDRGGAGYEGLLMGGGGSQAGEYLQQQAALAIAQQQQQQQGIGGWGRLAGGVSGVGSGAALLSSMDDLGAILPPNCSLDYTVPGMDSEVFGLVYKNDQTGQRGAVVWTGRGFHLFGDYCSEADAKQTIDRALAMLVEDRQLRGGSGMADDQQQQQLVSGLGLGLGGGGGRSGGFGGGGALGSGAVAFGESSSVRSGVDGIGGLANYDIARAARLAQEAAAQAGVSMQMSYPGALPAGTRLAPSGGSVAAAAAAGSLPVGESDLQTRLHQIITHKGEQQQQQQGAMPITVHASVDGGMLSRLANVDLAQLRALTSGLQQQGSQQGPQQQQQADGSDSAAADAAAAAAGTPGAAHAGLGSSIEDLVAAMAGGSKRRGTPAAAAAAGGGSGGTQSATSSGGGGGGLTPPPNWPELLGVAGCDTPAAGTGAAAAGDSGEDAVGPAAKRAKAGDGAAAGGLEAWSAEQPQAALQNLSKVGLQDALKALCAMSQQ